MPTRILISGLPGSGKSTLAAAIIDAVRARGWRVAGVVSPEIREDSRTGFRIVDLASGEQRIMASVDFESPDRVGKYGVDAVAVDHIARSFERSIPSADLLAIDEIGKMELFSAEFARVVEVAFASSKPLLAVVHRSLVRKYRSRGELVEMKRGALERLKDQILERLSPGSPRRA